jgi:hypothetical protein
MGFGCETLRLFIFDAMTAKAEPTPARSNLSQACGNPIIARFDGGQLSSRRAVAFAPKV